MRFEELRLIVYTKYLDGLAIYRYLDSTEFFVAYSLCKEDNDRLLNLENKIKDLDKNGVLTWVKNVLIEHKKYEYLDMRSLRLIASTMGIIHYTKCSKDQIVKLIKEVKNENSDSNRNQEVPK